MSQADKGNPLSHNNDLDRNPNHEIEEVYIHHEQYAHILSLSLSASHLGGEPTSSIMSALPSAILEMKQSLPVVQSPSNNNCQVSPCCFTQQ
mgnify:CR=1 FL=1